MAAVEVLTPAILQYITDGVYPTSEDIFSSALSSATIPDLLAKLHAEQSAVKDSLRGLSRTAAPDVDAWISEARTLRSDLARSKDSAGKIVQNAGRKHALEERLRDTGEKVVLLEREVEFNAHLSRVLEGVRKLNAQASETKEMLVAGDLATSVAGLKECEAAFTSLDLEGTGTGALLARRLDGLRTDVRSLVVERWDQQFIFDKEARSLRISLSLADDDVVEAATDQGMLDARLTTLAKDLDRLLLRSRMTISRNEQILQLAVVGEKISCGDVSDDLSTAALFADLEVMLQFLGSHVPPSVGLPLSHHFIPYLTSRLEEDWLQPALPLDISEVPAFQQTLESVTSLADQIDGLGWHGAKTLRDWVKNAPRAWLTKRREGVLGQIRNLVFTGIHETKTVERVEIQTVSKDDELAAQPDEGGDEWDEAWDDPSDPPTKTPVEDVDDDDASAWEVEDTEEKPEDDDGGEAWGWDDGDNTSLKPPASPKQIKKRASKASLATKNTEAKPNEQEITYRETFMVTSLPDGIIVLVKDLIKDSETLAGDEYNSSPIASAATALYTLPTLALAIYRATATTAYARLDSGNMLIYNDASRLADQLRAWQASQPPTSRLRLDNDVKTLERFARSAYSAAMEAQRTIIRDLLDGAQGFSNCANQPFKSACESAISDTLHHLRSVYKQWQPILSSSALLQSIGSLLATLTGKIIADVQELPDISEPDSKQLRILCDQTLEAKDLFTQTDPQNEDRDMTFIYCPTWMKFHYLGEIMESSLADIKHLWNEGELSLEFETEEVVGFIEALFAESPLRRSAIAEIRRGGKR